jgi:hypothetical protein
MSPTDFFSEDNAQQIFEAAREGSVLGVGRSPKLSPS